MTAGERLRALAGTAGSAATLLLLIGSGATAGAALTDYSNLPTGTAVQHLLAETAVGIISPAAGTFSYSPRGHDHTQRYNQRHTYTQSFFARYEDDLVAGKAAEIVPVHLANSVSLLESYQTVARLNRLARSERSAAQAKASADKEAIWQQEEEIAIALLMLCS